MKILVRLMILNFAALVLFPFAASAASLTFGCAPKFYRCGKNTECKWLNSFATRHTVALEKERETEDAIVWKAAFSEAYESGAYATPYPTTLQLTFSIWEDRKAPTHELTTAMTVSQNSNEAYIYSIQAIKAGVPSSFSRKMNVGLKTEPDKGAGWSCADFTFSP